jgi:predicted MFS family arabinose efflux permease
VTPVAIAALGGLGAGAIVGTLIAGVLLDRRRSRPFATD